MVLKLISYLVIKLLSKPNLLKSDHRDYKGLKALMEEDFQRYILVCNEERQGVWKMGEIMPWRYF